MEVKELIEQLKVSDEVESPEALIEQFKNATLESYKKEANININEHANKIIDGAFKKVGKELGLELEFKEGAKQSEVLTSAIKEWKASQQDTGSEWKEKYEEVIKKQPDSEKLRKEIEEQVRGDFQKNYDEQLKKHKSEYEKQLQEKDQKLNDYKITNAFTRSLPKFDQESIEKFGKDNFDVVVDSVIRDIRSKYEMQEDNGKIVAKNGFDSHDISSLLKDNDRLKPFISKEHRQEGGGAGQAGFKETFGIDPKLPLHELQDKVREHVEKSVKKSDDPVKFAKLMDETMEKILSPKKG